MMMKKTIRKVAAALGLAAVVLGAAQAQQGGQPHYIQGVVNFESGSTHLDREAMGIIESMIQYAKASGMRVAFISVLGHADITGEWNANDYLGSDRAVEVGSAFGEKLGITNFSIESKASNYAHPGCEPLGNGGKTKKCLAANRRAEITIVFEGQAVGR